MKTKPTKQTQAATMTSTTTTATTTSPSAPTSSAPTSSTQLAASSNTSIRPLFKSYMMFVLIIIAQLAEAKPLNQYQVKFRRVPPKEFSAALGASITIECEAGASPPPTIHWLKDGKRIIQVSVFSMVNRPRAPPRGHLLPWGPPAVLLALVLCS
jgi:hypothetical protein